MKRIVAILLALLMLFGGVAMADEDLNAIVQRLEGYIDTLMESKGKGVSTTTLEECLVLLEGTKSRKKKPLELYCKILLAIERNQFDDAYGDMFVLSRESMANSFEEDFVKSSGGDTPISTVKELYYYLQGREAEHGEKYVEALAFYDNCLTVFDTYYRAEDIKCTLYDSAINLYVAGDYEQAASLLEKLSQMQYPEAVRSLKEFSTPTPKPTPVPTPTPSPTPTPVPTPTPEPVKLTVGDYVEFGRYPQTATGNDDTPIEWLVLESDNETALLISRYALDCMSYNNELTAASWEASTIRKWLNDEFYNQAFNAEEARNIVRSNISASGNSGSATKDEVFLLSVAEVNAYFASNEARQCAATDYAIRQGVHTSSSYKVDGKKTCFWWLCSPGSQRNTAANIYCGGSVDTNGRYVTVDDFGVRPCVRVRLS